MTKIFEISTTKYDEDEIVIKKSLWNLESLLQTANGFQLSKPVSKFGWTFVRLALKENFFLLIEEKFSDMLARYKGKKEEKFTKFLEDYFSSKGCDVRLKLIED